MHVICTNRLAGDAQTLWVHSPDKERPPVFKGGQTALEKRIGRKTNHLGKERRLNSMDVKETYSHFFCYHIHLNIYGQLASLSRNYHKIKRSECVADRWLRFFMASAIGFEPMMCYHAKLTVSCLDQTRLSWHMVGIAGLEPALPAWKAGLLTC